MADPYPITLTQVDAEDFDEGVGEPVPFVVVGPIPSAGGGGGVTSVNTKTGVVTLTASDVGARAAGNVPWGEVTGVPATLTAAAAAGTPSIRAIGTTSTTAKAGDYQPTWAQVTAKPATISAIPTTLGTAGQILAVNAAGTGLEWITPA